MLKDLAPFLSHLFATSAEKAENAALLEGLMVEDKMTEPTAYAVLLTDLARSDGHYDQKERAVISHTLQRLFPELNGSAAIILETAENVVDTFRGPRSFVERIREEYSVQERDELLRVINSVISSDGHEEPVEVYLRSKFRALLS